MRCLCCGKELDKNSTLELSNRWHNKCIKKFFGIDTLPDIEINEEKLLQIAVESSSKGLTIPGVQKKLSLYLSISNKPKLTIVDYPTGYILKPQTKEYAFLPESEYLVMTMAKITKINTVPFALIQINNETNELAYITKRIDRQNKNTIEKLAMEDFCQLANRLTEDKYGGSYERCSKIIDEYSCVKGLDKSDLFLRIVFSFVVGNSDMHLKNFSLIEISHKSGLYRLSDAYDMLPVNLLLPEDKDELALTLNCNKRNITKNDIKKFGINIGLNNKQIEKMINKVVSLKDEYIYLCRKSYLNEEMKQDFIKLINMRIDRLK